MQEKFRFKFIDLFSGIGAFHQALEALGGECVFASDIDKYAIETYYENYKMDSNCNIRDVNEKDIPEHDVLCGGFPCQAFSTAGHKKGFEDTRGTLFFEIARILKYHATKYIILENVKNLLGHDNGNTWKVIKNTLIELGYILTEKPIVMSPNYLGIPQLRERVFILGMHKSQLKKANTGLFYKKDGDLFLGEDIFLNIKTITRKEAPETSIYSVLDELTDEEAKDYEISDYEKRTLMAWDEFHKNIEPKVLGFPVWTFEFGGTYDYSDFPKWKQDYVKKNRKLYLDNKEFIDKWMAEYNVNDFKLRDKKFEWQAGEKYNSVWETSIQLRQSGIRCKKADYFPTLVAMVQTPIIGKYKRRMTPREVARLQSFPDSFIINKDLHQAYKQFGNSANIEIIKYLARQLLIDLISD
ncbi:MAG: DNA cytosine methyltransferase [Treponema sp.]|nr:DNA cytosine methyltransferase [Treponema sp.]